MNKKDRKSVGLVGGPNQYITDISEFVSIEGYKRNSPDVNNPYNIIESGNITMEDVDFPVYGRDNLGNEQIMEPGGGNYQFPGDSVLEIPMAQYAGEIPSPMEDPNGFLYQIEDLIGYHLDYPNGKGETFATMPGEENSIDNLRHAGSARYTAEAIGQKVKDIPYVGGLLDFVGVDKAAGLIGANVLGLGHELTSFFGEDERSFLTKMQEMGEDSFNNLVGSIVGSTDMNSDKKDQLLKKLSFNNILPDGYVSTENGRKNGLSEDIYFKDEEGKRKTPEYKRGGGLLDKTMECNSCGWEWKAADGGADVSTCHKCGSSALPKAQDGNKEWIKNWIGTRNATGQFEDQLGNGQMEKGFKSLDDVKKVSREEMVEAGNDDASYWQIGAPNGMYVPSDNIYFSDPGFFSGNKEEDTDIHEQSHVFDIGTSGVPQKDMEEEIPETNIHKAIKNIPVKGEYETEEYLPPAEIYAELMKFRKKNNIDPNKIYTKDDLLELRKKLKEENDYGLFKLDDIYEDKEILRLMNEVATIDTPQENNIRYAQNGSETAPIQLDEVVIKADKEKSSLNKWGHGILDAAGLVPGFGEIADGVNALWYAAEGDNTNAALSTAAMVPFLGWGATATKFGLKGVKALKGTKNIAKEVVENTVKVADDVKPSWSRGVTNYGNSPQGIQDALTSMKSQGKHLDEIGFNVDDVIAPNVINHGNKFGRQIAEVALPNGQSQLFYKSSGLAGKKGVGKTGTTEGLWQPYGGHASTGATDNWFIKDAGYENFYDSNSFKAIANKLDEIESGWDMSKQVLKSKLKYGGIPKAQRGGSTQPASTISNDILLRQTFAESSFKPGAKSNVGAQGLTQFMPDTIEYLIERGTLPADFDIHDPKQAVMAQKLYMDDIYNKDFINKPNQSDQVRLAKTLAAYNGGPTRLKNILTAQKKEGVDIYNSLDWMSALPKESKEYIDLILLNKNTTGRPKFNENFDNLLNDEKYKQYIDLYQQGGSTNYTVASGDNLSRIAKKYNTSVQKIVDLNNIADANEISINQELIIPESQTQQASITSAYKVRSGDTLGKIAKTYNTTAKNLAEYNGIKNINQIYPDQEIAIPDNIRKLVDKPEPAWHKVDKVKDRNKKTNDLTDTNIIMQSQMLNNPNQSYVIIDKKTGQLRVMNGEDEALSFEVLTGDNPGDAQTVTKMHDFNKDGKITDKDRNWKNQWVTDWTAGNKSTGAGIYSINSSSPTSKPGYQNAPSWTLLNDNGIEVSTAIHGTTNYRKQFFNDGNTENNQASNGCINGQCSDLDALYDLDLPQGTPVFILPEDKGNNFILQDGKAIMKMSSDNRKEYLEYTDSTGKKQKGQGGNYSTNTLVYKPIRANFNREKFEEERFTTFDFNDTEELEGTTIPFIKALEDNKKKIMQEAQIPGDVYNQIAKIAFGVYGTESEFGDTHSWAGNAARGANKKYGTDGSSPDVTKKYEGFDLPFTDAGAGAQSNNNSVGYTQIRWSQLNDKEKKVLKAFDITSNKDFMDPSKSAIATASILGVRYNEQLNAEQKKDIWSHLPGKWNNRSNYAKRVKENSTYLDFEQKDVMRKGGEIENHIMYKNYVNGIYDGSKMEVRGAKIYDKLNRIHYRDAKASNMTPSNYVLTKVIG